MCPLLFIRSSDSFIDVVLISLSVQCHLLKVDSLVQVLVPLCGLLLRALYVEAGVHSGCLHGGSFLRRPGGDSLYP